MLEKSEILGFGIRNPDYDWKPDSSSTDRSFTGFQRLESGIQNPGLSCVSLYGAIELREILLFQGNDSKIEVSL